jgi:hypothetical protein
LKPRGEEAIGAWRKPRNEELHNLYSSQYIITMMKLRQMRWAQGVPRMGEKRVELKCLVGKSEGKISRARSRRVCENNTKIGLK